MSDTGSLAQRMAAAARQLQSEHDDPQATFKLSVELAHESVVGCDAVGLSFVHARKRVTTVASTDRMAVDADLLQYELGEGPCLDSIWEQRTVHSPNLKHDDRWPRWGPRVASETKAQSILAFQLFTHEDTLGALNMYSQSRDAFDDDAREEGLAIAAQVAIAVAAAQQVQHLHTAVDSRTVTGQATGILMERFDLEPHRAFSVLVRLSSQRNVKLRELAAEIVANRREDNVGDPSA